MTTHTRTSTPINLLVPGNWSDYELLDSGAGAKLERFGPYRFVRPESGTICRARCTRMDGGRWDFRHHG